MSTQSNNQEMSYIDEKNVITKAEIDFVNKLTKSEIDEYNNSIGLLRLCDVLPPTPYYSDTF